MHKVNINQNEIELFRKLLGEKKYNILILYFVDQLTNEKISINYNISRQGINKIIQCSLQKIQFYLDNIYNIYDGQLVRKPVSEDSNIAVLDLNMYAYNALIGFGINTIGDFSNYSLTELMVVKGLSHNSLKLLLEKLSNYGVTLKEVITEFKKEAITEFKKEAITEFKKDKKIKTFVKKPIKINIYTNIRDKIKLCANDIELYRELLCQKDYDILTAYYIDILTYEEISIKFGVSQRKIINTIKSLAKQILFGLENVYNIYNSKLVQKSINMESSIAVLNLNNRAYKILTEQGIRTIQDLNNYTLNTLYAINGFSIVSLKELLHKLNDYGFHPKLVLKEFDTENFYYPNLLRDLKI